MKCLVSHGECNTKFLDYYRSINMMLLFSVCISDLFSYPCPLVFFNVVSFRIHPKACMDTKDN